ncbi:MAG: phage tail tube protein [Candidatus Omnitrophota bacterium]|jgi:predicted secreted protein
MTSAVSGFGTDLTWNSVVIAEVINVSGPNQSRDMIEVTNHDSANGFKEFIAGLADGGEVTIEGNFKAGDTTGQIALHTDFQAGTSRTLLITFPSSLGNMSGTAFCTAFEMTFPHDNKIGFSATFKYTGKPTLTIS